MSTTIKIPAYKLYFNSIKDPTLLEILIYKLYNINQGFKLNLLYKLIFILESIAFTKRDNSGERFDSGKSQKKYTKADSFPEKFVQEISPEKSYSVKGIKEDNTVRSVLRTVPYKIWILKLRNGKILRCADWHLIMTEYGWQRVSDIHTGTLV